jgi:hypothetical protein
MEFCCPSFVFEIRIRIFSLKRKNVNTFALPKCKEDESYIIINKKRECIQLCGISSKPKSNKKGRISSKGGMKKPGEENEGVFIK